MIDQLCKSIEHQAQQDGHVIGKGFVDAFLLKIKMLRMDCQICDYFVIIDPKTGKHIQSSTGRCPGTSK
jgi:hypothetical protein